MPDLLVRSDYINEFMGYQVIDDDEAKIPSPNLEIKYHYKVIDIKHSTIYLKSDNKYILNTGSIPMYKGQLYIYTMALNNTLGININMCTDSSNSGCIKACSASACDVSPPDKCP